MPKPNATVIFTMLSHLNITSQMRHILIIKNDHHQFDSIFICIYSTFVSYKMAKYDSHICNAFAFKHNFVNAPENFIALYH